MSGSTQQIGKSVIHSKYTDTFAIEQNKSLGEVEVRDDLYLRGKVYKQSRMGTSATSASLTYLTGDLSGATPASTFTFSGTSDVLTGTGTWAASFAMDALFGPEPIVCNSVATGGFNIVLLPNAVNIIKAIKNAQVGTAWELEVVNATTKAAIEVQLPSTNTGTTIGQISLYGGSGGGAAVVSNSGTRYGAVGANVRLVFVITNILAGSEAISCYLFSASPIQGAMGGAVTQITSLTTAVTLNAVAGQITMQGAVSSTSGAVTTAAFTLNNAFIQAGSTVQCWISNPCVSLVGYISPSVVASSITGGSCLLTVTNNDAATATNGTHALNSAAVVSFIVW